MSRNSAFDKPCVRRWLMVPQQPFAHVRRYRVLRSVLLAAFLWHTNAVAESSDTPSFADLSATLDTALKRLDATNLDDDWYFTMEVVEADELRTIHSDPHGDKYEKRQLISVNGVAPDEDDLEDFHDREVQRIDGEDPDAAGYEYMVDLQTLQLLETGDGYARFSFTPRVKAFENSRDKIRGSLLLNTTSQQIDQIEIFNTEQLSPVFSVTVNTFRLTLQFQHEQGEQVLNKLESDTKGKAGFVKSFDVQVLASFSDYKRAGPESMSEMPE